MGPLAGIKIVEMAGVGPAPMCAMLLAGMGATVLRVERKEGNKLGIPRPRKFDIVLRDRPAIQVDLKSPAGIALARELSAGADALIEGFRPGTMEKLGLGPDECLAANPRLVYGRVTGWGQGGPLAQTAGHDLNYIALTGMLDAIGPAKGPPAIPLNVLGDYGGGALYLAMGVLAAIIHARSSGRGQVVDSAMIDGVASLSTLFHGLLAGGVHHPIRGMNILDGGAHFYNVYQCADDRWVAVAPIEPKFYEQLIRLMGIDLAALGEQYDPTQWPQAREVFARAFRARSRNEWASLLESTDACFSEVLTFAEAPDHPHMRARSSFVDVEGVRQPASAPRFSATPLDNPKAPAEPSAQATVVALKDWLSAERLEAARVSGAI